jgi:hypothetical protein
LSFLKFGEAMEQRLTGNETEHGVSEELEHFVIANGRTTAKRAATRAQRLYLARLRAVGKRLFEKFQALEAVTQAFFQRRNFT